MGYLGGHKYASGKPLFLSRPFALRWLVFHLPESVACRHACRVFGLSLAAFHHHQPNPNSLPSDSLFTQVWACLTPQHRLGANAHTIVFLFLRKIFVPRSGKNTVSLRSVFGREYPSASPPPFGPRSTIYLLISSTTMGLMTLPAKKRPG